MGNLELARIAQIKYIQKEVNRLVELVRDNELHSKTSQTSALQWALGWPTFRIRDRAYRAAAQGKLCIHKFGNSNFYYTPEGYAAKVIRLPDGRYYRKP